MSAVRRMGMIGGKKFAESDRKARFSGKFHPKKRGKYRPDPIRRGFHTAKRGEGGKACKGKKKKGRKTTSLRSSGVEKECQSVVGIIA